MNNKNQNNLKPELKNKKIKLSDGKKKKIEPSDLIDSESQIHCLDLFYHFKHKNDEFVSVKDAYKLIDHFKPKVERYDDMIDVKKEGWGSASYESIDVTIQELHKIKLCK